MLRIGIALFHQRHRQPVRAEDQMHFLGIGKLVQNAVDALDDSGDVVGMIEEMIDHMHGDARLVEAVPFLQAAAGGGEGIVRIERKQHQFVVGRAFQRCDGLFGAGMPVAHGHDGARGNVQAQRRFEGLGLPLGEAPDGRASADFGIVLAHASSSAWWKSALPAACAPERNRGN